MTVRRFLDLSTGHLKPETRQKFDRRDAPALAYPHPDGFGWLVWVSSDPNADDELPEDFRGCVAKARELDCDYILFDTDADSRADLVTYDDAGNVETAAATVDEDDPDRCTDAGGHKFVETGTAYGGDDDRWHGEGRSLCIHCGADGDA